ncbi:uncharacterized protein SCHCODRAFT_01094803 [Schizophyllum commune H4-8]|nr:uncharacterized protein SCHCODRAFT_01094803 [Schizophyllum commune H4-8]KAI5892897.1 hypothetical protein SCHCODRAFT_01094803 [Schizophyllum commune H4-8]
MSSLIPQQPPLTFLPLKTGSLADIHSDGPISPDSSLLWHAHLADHYQLDTWRARLHLDLQFPLGIWRKWEDCLWFQETLEYEYTRLAREKRRRLTSGKGVKKNGLYVHDAASFESLPMGPDPTTVAKDVHDLIPRLTKKGTFFRASQETIEQRATELRRLIEALFRDDVPALLNDLRNDRMVTDFFGYWRRDYDLAKKQGREPEFGSSRSSIGTNTQFSGAQSEASGSRSSGGRHNSSSSFDYASDTTTSPRSSRTSGSKRISMSSSSSSSSSSRHSMSSAGPSVVVVPTSPHMQFGHDPAIDKRSSIGLEALPENHEMLLKAGLARRSLPTSERRPAVRESWQTMDSATTYLEGLSLSDGEDHWQEHARRGSIASVASVATIRTADSADAVLPRGELGANLRRASSARDHSPSSRYSSISVISRMDTPTFEKFPLPPFNDKMVNPPGPTFIRRPSQYSLEEPYPIRPETPMGHRASISTTGSHLDIPTVFPPPRTSSMGPRRPPSPGFRPTSPIHYAHDSAIPPVPPLPAGIASSPPRPSSAAAFYRPRGSSTASSARPGSSGGRPGSSHPSSSRPNSSAGTEPQLAIKAAHNNTIILLRATRSIPFGELRRRLHDKFVKQEGVPLSEDFTVAFHAPPAEPQVSEAAARLGVRQGRARSSSLSAGILSMQFINSQAEWERALQDVDVESGKLHLRILDTPA